MSVCIYCDRSECTGKIEDHCDWCGNPVSPGDPPKKPSEVRYCNEGCKTLDESENYQSWATSLDQLNAITRLNKMREDPYEYFKSAGYVKAVPMPVISIQPGNFPFSPAFSPESGRNVEAEEPFDDYREIEETEERDRGRFF